MYRGSVFFISKSIVEIPVTLICSILASAIMPTLAGFQIDDDRWICFLCNHFFLSLASVNVVKGFVFLGSTVFNGYAP
jgi:ABC-type multidrug transport system permease subunit